MSFGRIAIAFLDEKKSFCWSSFHHSMMHSVLRVTQRIDALIIREFENPHNISLFRTNNNTKEKQNLKRKMMQIVSAFDEDSPIQAFLRGGNDRRSSSEGKDLEASCSTLRTAASSSAGDISQYQLNGGFVSQSSLSSTNQGFNSKNNYVDGNRDNPISLDEDDEDEDYEEDAASSAFISGFNNVAAAGSWPSMMASQQGNHMNHHHQRHRGSGSSTSMSSLSDSMSSLNNAFKNLNSNRPACASNLLLLANSSLKKQHDLQQQQGSSQQQGSIGQYLMKQRSSSADSLVSSRGSMLKASSLSSELIKTTTSGDERRRKVLQTKFKRSGMTSTAAAIPSSPIATRPQRKSGMLLPFRGPRQHSVIKAKLSLGLRNRLVMDLIQKQSSKRSSCFTVSSAIRAAKAANYR